MKGCLTSSSHCPACAEANLTEDQAGVDEAEQNRLEMTRSLSRRRSGSSSGEKGRVPEQDRVPWHKRLERRWRKYWDSNAALSGRKRLSHRLTALKHSQHAKYAFKMGLGIALLSIPGFMPSDSAGESTEKSPQLMRGPTHYGRRFSCRPAMVHLYAGTMGKSHHSWPAPSC